MNLMFLGADAPANGSSGTGSASDAIAAPVGMITNLAKQAADWAISKGPMVLAALVLLVVAWILAGWARRWVIAGAQRVHVDLTLSKFLGTLVKWTIIVFAVIACLGTFGINTTSLAAVVGAVGLAVGLALQGNLSNLASGILILIFRPFKIGDMIVAAGQTGVVDGIDLFTTNLDTLDNRRIIVPNAAIMGGVIENQTKHSQRCVMVNVAVAGTATLEEATRALEAAARRTASETPGASAEPQPRVDLADLAPAVTWTVSVWADSKLYLEVRRALLREVKVALDAAKIAPALPTMDINVRSMPAADMSGRGGDAIVEIRGAPAAVGARR